MHRQPLWTKVSVQGQQRKRFSQRQQTALRNVIRFEMKLNMKLVIKAHVL